MRAISDQNPEDFVLSNSWCHQCEHRTRMDATVRRHWHVNIWLLMTFLGWISDPDSDRLSPPSLSLLGLSLPGQTQTFSICYRIIQNSKCWSQYTLVWLRRSSCEVGVSAEGVSDSAVISLVKLEGNIPVFPWRTPSHQPSSTWKISFKGKTNQVPSDAGEEISSRGLSG